MPTTLHKDFWIGAWPGVAIETFPTPPPLPDVVTCPNCGEETLRKNSTNNNWRCTDCGYIEAR